MGSCSKRELFMWDPPMLTHKRTGLCLDVNDLKTPILYPCYKQEVMNAKQHWRHVDGHFIQSLSTQKCLDYLGRETVRVVSAACDRVEARWEEYRGFEPIETTLFKQQKREMPHLFTETYTK
eukprot:2582359-Rhodomonas_salina.1